MFGYKALSDVVKGIRANKDNEDQYILSCISEIKDEIKSNDPVQKSIAIQKLTYLNMLGYDMSWAAFHVTQLMSCSVFSYKRVGYLAAAQCFHSDTDVLIMVTQQLKKDLLSNNQYESGLAISCLSNICTAGLAQDLVSDVVTLLNSTRPYVRKKAVLVLFKIFLEYPDALPPTFDRLKEKLTDTHPCKFLKLIFLAVVANAVNVITELAKRNPKNYLGLAPQFYKLLTSLNSNWTLIKIVKLLGDLCPHEPRLGKKLVDPFTNIVNTTNAKSLLYECLFTITKGMHDQKGILRLAVEKLKGFVTDKDQNCLLGLNNIMGLYPKLVADMKDTILSCLDDEDETIRLRATDLLCGVVTKKNIKNIVGKLIKLCKSSEGSLRNLLIEKIIDTCSKNNYENIASFNWYLEILAEMTEIKGNEKGELIAFQLKNCFIRVKSIRSWGITEIVKLITASHFQQENLEKSSMLEVLGGCAWIIGEFINEAEVKPKQVLYDILKTPFQSYPPTVQSIYIQTFLKIYTAAACGSIKPQSEMLLGEKPEKLGQEHYDSIAKLREDIKKGIESFLKSPDVEVQERSSTCYKILQLHSEFLDSGIDIAPQMKSLFEEELNPVAPGSQKKVPLPEGLDLDTWINDPKEFEEEKELEYEPSFNNQDDSRVGKMKSGSSNKMYYLGKGKSDVSVPTRELSELGISDKPKVKKGLKKTGTKKKTPEIIETYEISTTEEKPEGYVPEKVEKEKKKDKLSEVVLTDVSIKKELPKVKEYKTITKEEIQKKEEEEKKKKMEEKTVEKKVGEKKVGEKKTITKKKTEKKEEKKESLLSFDEPKKEEKKEEKKKETKKEEPKKTTKTKRKKIAHDENVSILFNPKVLPYDPTHIDVPLTIENISTFNLSSIEYSVQSTMNLRTEKVGTISAGFQLSPGTSGEITLNLTFKTFERAQALGVTLNYTVDKKGAPEKKTLAIKVKFPCSMFFVQKQISQDQFSQLIKNKEIPYSVQKKFKYSEKIQDFATAVKEFSNQLNCAIIGTVQNQSAFMYGTSIQNHHLAIILQSKGDTEINVDVKCTVDSISNDVMSEIIHMFGKTEKK